jgi:hypothetical protein
MGSQPLPYGVGLCRVGSRPSLIMNSFPALNENSGAMSAISVSNRDAPSKTVEGLRSKKGGHDVPTGSEC